MNLVSNSLKFTFNGYIKIFIKPVWNTAQRGLKSLNFTVKDTGIGISKKDQRNLFKLFGTVSKHRQTVNSKGTGLGLTITSKLVNLLGGEISLTSIEGKGTQIDFVIKESERFKEFKRK